jgi:hypothetical protein
MVTKKWRKNFAAPFCVAERQQRPPSPQSAIPPPETVVVLANYWVFARRFIVFAGGALGRALSLWVVSSPPGQAAVVKVIDESCFQAPKPDCQKR